MVLIAPTFHEGKSPWRIETLGFRRLCSYLRGEHPATWHVSIRRRRKNGVAGFHQVRGGMHYVTVDPGLDCVSTRSVLFHEWAHVLDAERQFYEDTLDDPDHNDRFWGFYAEIWKGYLS